MYANIKERYGCVDCGYFTDVNCNIKRHMLSKPHLLKIEPTKVDLLCKHQCKICDKKYNSQQGLWSHNQKCKIEEVEKTSVVQTIPELSSKIDKLENIIAELVKNQQQPTVINNININIFLNDKCCNAINLVDFLKNIQFDDVNFDRIVSDYVNGNAEIIAKNYNALPELERPFYSFKGEDKNQEIAHIKYQDKWVTESEVNWGKKLRLGQSCSDGEENFLVPDSMYSLVRMFDKNKISYYNRIYSENDLYKKSRQLERHSFEADLQSELISKLMTMATITVCAEK
jgi:lipopolysaccharide export LptBFGC system permease protein LptF